MERTFEAEGTPRAEAQRQARVGAFRDLQVFSVQGGVERSVGQVIGSPSRLAEELGLYPESGKVSGQGSGSGAACTASCLTSVLSGTAATHHVWLSSP